jgi:hypothetical protein
MKESSCHDPKMVAYYQAVRLLEDKFDGLELNHIARRSNEATDELTKLATGRALAPTSVFASDLHKPSVTYQGSAQGANEPPKPGSGLSQPCLPLILKSWTSRRTQMQGPTPCQTGEFCTSNA